MNDYEATFDLFDRLGISHETVRHEAFHSAEAMQGVDLAQWEFPVKNFFVYDKKKNFFLITVRLNSPSLDLKQLGKDLGAKGRFSFAKNQTLAEKLGVLPGSVSPYAVYNDSDCTVQVVVDDRLRECQSISAHPLSNDQTTTISVEDLQALYAHTGHAPIWLKMPFIDEASETL